MKKKVIKTICIILATISITMVIGIALIIEPNVRIYGFTELDENRLNNIKNTLVIYGDDGKTELNSGDYTPLKKINKHTIAAFLCAEDKRFYEHEGIDYSRIVSAIIKDLKDRSFSQGASTITQQLIKNSHLSNTKSISRKIQEIRLSRDIERKYSKDEILEMYFNILYFGNGIYGIGSASKNFFGKDISDINIQESAVLASIINNPSLYNPYTNSKRLFSRVALILKLMKDNGNISDNEYASAISSPITINEQTLYDKYKCFVIKEACDILGCNEELLLHNNIKIYCNCNYALQKNIANYLKPYKDVKCIQVIIIENSSGKIIAHEAKYSGDPSTLARSPGSTIKPIICYAPALEKQIILPITPILDEKTSFKDYTPSNYKNKYYGWVSCKYALKESLNIPAIKLLDYVGIDYAKEFSEKMGIKTNNDEGLSLALGGMTYGTELKNIAAAYSIFARGGIKKNCSYIKAIYMNDRLIYSAPNGYEKVMSPETAYFINEMLNECAKSGTAKRLNAHNFDIAAKTGTVGTKNGNTDAYCIAYTPDYTVGVHIMQDANGNISGGGVPTLIAKNLIMSDIISNKTFEIPKSIVKVDIDSIKYHKNQKIVQASNDLPKKDRISASFPVYALPEQLDNRSDYEKGLDFFDMNNFTIIDSFGY